MGMRESVIAKIHQSKVIAIVRGLGPGRMLDLAQALCDGGISLIEITFDQSSPDSWQDTCDGIRALNAHFAGKVLAGAGTVMTAAQAQMARDAGAAYIISPNADPVVIRATRVMDMVSIPGCMTATEAAAAYDAGADFAKIFPAGTLGPEYIRAIRAPLKHIPMLAVGGVNERNAADFIAAGCAGVGVGGNLVNKQWIAEGRFDFITALAQEYAQAVTAQ